MMMTSDVLNNPSGVVGAWAAAHQLAGCMCYLGTTCPSVGRLPHSKAPNLVITNSVKTYVRMGLYSTCE